MSIWNLGIAILLGLVFDAVVGYGDEYDYSQYDENTDATGPDLDLGPVVPTGHSGSEEKEPGDLGGTMDQSFLCDYKKVNCTRTALQENLTASDPNMTLAHVEPYVECLRPNDSIPIRCVSDEDHVVVVKSGEVVTSVMCRGHRMGSIDIGFVDWFPPKPPDMKCQAKPTTVSTTEPTTVTTETVPVSHPVVTSNVPSVSNAKSSEKPAPIDDGGMPSDRVIPSGSVNKADGNNANSAQSSADSNVGNSSGSLSESKSEENAGAGLGIVSAIISASGVAGLAAGLIAMAIRRRRKRRSLAAVSQGAGKMAGAAAIPPAAGSATSGVGAASAAGVLGAAGMAAKSTKPRGGSRGSGAAGSVGGSQPTNVRAAGAKVGSAGAATSGGAAVAAKNVKSGGGLAKSSVGSSQGTKPANNAKASIGAGAGGSKLAAKVGVGGAVGAGTAGGVAASTAAVASKLPSRAKSAKSLAQMDKKQSFGKPRFSMPGVKP